MNPVKQWATKMAVCGMLIGTIGTAYAANPHFVGRVTATINNMTGTAELCFKVAGLGNNEGVDITASATATATYVCRNQGGNCPNAANKKTVTGPVSATQQFTSDRNGQVQACISLNPPSAGNFTCPGNQQVVFSSVTYSNLKVAIGDDGPSATARPSTLSVDKGECPQQ